MTVPQPQIGRPALVDLHCHLLPGLDDGAKSPQMCFEMASMAAAAGVRQIVCTPHCTTGDPYIHERTVRIQRAVEILNYVFQEKQLPVALHSGIELLCNNRLQETLEKKDFLTLAGSRYLLIEFDFDASLAWIERAANAVCQAGYIPVLAHPERYTAVWRNPECLSVWFYAGYMLQLDKDSVLGRFGNHCAQTADWALRHGVAHAIASDAHGIRTRAASLDQVRDYVAQCYSPDYADLLVRRNPARVVRNEALEKPSD